MDEMMANHAKAMSQPDQTTEPAAVSAPVTEEVKDDTSTGSPTSQTEPAAEAKEADNGGSKESTAPASATETETPTVEEPDYGKFLEVSSEGLFKTVDDFKSSLSKIREYDELKSKLESKENENPFANDYVRKLNDLYKGGKTSEQIEAFNSIQKLGDLDKLDPFDAKVQRLIFEHGWPKAVAERNVRREFGLNLEVEGDHLSEEEIEENKNILEENKYKLASSAKDDINFLREQMAKIESDDDAKQTKMLQDAAARSAYEKKLQPFVDDLAKGYETELNIPVKRDKDEYAYKLGFDDNFRMDVAKMAREFFMETPVNEQTVREFKDYANASFVAQNLTTKIIPDTWNDGFSNGYKKAVDEYENKSGLPQSGQTPVSDDANKALLEQQRKVAFGEI